MAKHWIFDLDGTLINSHPLYKNVFQEIVKEQKFEIVPVAWDELYHVSLPKFLEKYFPANHRENLLKLVIDKNIERQNEIEVFKGIPEAIQHLHNAGCVLSICTARELRSTTEILRSTKLDHYFSKVISRDCVPETKPHPEGIHRLMTSAESHSHETLMVGDHNMDIQAAKNAGICSVSVSWGGVSTEDLSLQSDHHFDEVAVFHQWMVEKTTQK